MNRWPTDYESVALPTELRWLFSIFFIKCSLWCQEISFVILHCLRFHSVVIVCNKFKVEMNHICMGLKKLARDKVKHTVLTGSFLSTVSHSPGVYLMKGKSGKIIYVGKARDLRKRLASYAHFHGAEHSKTGVMIAQIHTVETILTSTEKEALILEASLIKKHRPKYNVILRDDKNYPLIKVTVNETWPRVMMTRRKARDKARYFGPYASTGAMWASLKLLHSVFPLRRCKGKEVKKRTRPCLNSQMQKCLAPCVGGVDKDAYAALVKDVLLVLEGRNKELVKKIKVKMDQAACRLDFEKAALFRDQIVALNKTIEKQVVAGSGSAEQDVFGLAWQGESVAVFILTVRNSMVLGQRSFYLAEPVGDKCEILSEILKRYYQETDSIPREIVLPFLPDDSQLLQEWLMDLKKSAVHFRVPQRGDVRRLLEMAVTNAEQVFVSLEKKEKAWTVLADSLMKTLHLRRRPDRIECLDISNLSGKEAVGSLVCFQQGEKAAKLYRHYKIKTVSGPDDYQMMAEVIGRRLKRGVQEDTLPDLFMVDGGRGQLGIAARIVEEFGLTERIDLVGIAKEKKEEGEKLYRPGRKNPIKLARHTQLLLFLMNIRDESHRYGITFHRKLRHKKAFASELDEISGIGPSRKNNLLKALGSVGKIKQASVEELAKVPGIGNDQAQIIYTFFHQ